MRERSSQGRYQPSRVPRVDQHDEVGVGLGDLGQVLVGIEAEVVLLAQRVEDDVDAALGELVVRAERRQVDQHAPLGEVVDHRLDDLDGAVAHENPFGAEAEVGGQQRGDHLVLRGVGLEHVADCTRVDQLALEVVEE